MSKAKVPAGPQGWPWIGSMLEARRDPLAFTLRLGREYGGVARFHLGPYKGYLVSDPEGVRRVLQTHHSSYDKQNYDYDMLRPFLGEGLLTSDGDRWLQERRLIQPSFHQEELGRFFQSMAHPIQQMIEAWQPLAEETGIVDVAGEMNRLALEVVSRALFGSGLGPDREQVLEAFRVLNHQVARRFQSLLVLPFWVPSPGNRAARRAIAQIDRVLMSFTAEREANGFRGGLLRTLSEAHGGSTGGAGRDRRVRDEIVTLTLAGHETTAALLSWTFYLLGQHPEAADRVWQEAVQVLAGREPRPTDLEKLVFTERVLKEAMRLYPPVWIVSRRAKEDDLILGYRIPADSVVALSPYATQRDPAYWNDPERFDPQRFSPGRQGTRHPFAYFPFGGGPRKCIGGGFALMEAKMVVASVVQHYRLEPADGHPVRPQPLVTLRPKGGLPMVVRRVDPGG